MEPLIPSTAREALRKYIDLNHGTEKETTARRMVAVKVTRKPGVAGLIGKIVYWRVFFAKSDDGEPGKGKLLRDDGSVTVVTALLGQTNRGNVLHSHLCS